jgi:hypothetical protein
VCRAPEKEIALIKVAVPAGEELREFWRKDGLTANRDDDIALAIISNTRGCGRTTFATERNGTHGH